MTQITRALLDKTLANLLNSARRDGADLAVLESGPRINEWRWRVGPVRAANVWPAWQLQPMVAKQILRLLKDQAGLSGKTLEQTTGFTLSDGQSLRLKLNYSQTGPEEKLLLEFLPAPDKNFSLAELGLGREHSETLGAAILPKTGLVLICGPRAAGKQTTAYALLQSFNPARFNVVTVEQPVKQDLPAINQVPLTPLLLLHWPNLISQLKQQDPDIIYLANPSAPADWRELAELADAKLVVISLAADSLYDGLKNLERLLARQASLGRLKLALFQKLARRVCGACAEPKKLDYKILDQLHNRFELEDTRALRQLEHWQGRGCEHCQHSGLNGQIGLYEMLSPDPVLQKKLSAGLKPSHKRLLTAALAPTMQEDAFDKTFAGLIPVTELLRL